MQRAPIKVALTARLTSSRRRAKRSAGEFAPLSGLILRLLVGVIPSLLHVTLMLFAIIDMSATRVAFQGNDLSTPHNRTASVSLADEIHLFQTSLIVVSALVRALGQFDF